jgi:hypothetical protein
MRTSSFLLYKDHCRLKPIGDTRIFTVEISAYTGKEPGHPFPPSSLSIAFCTGSLAGGILFSQGCSVTTVTADAVGTCQRPRIALRDGKLLQQCADSPGACGKNGFPEDDSSVGAKLSM